MGLRILMMEIERIAVHLDNLSEVARLADSAAVRLKCGSLRELLLRATAAAFGHRLMMDCVVPGGLAADIAENGAETILRALGTIASEVHSIRRLSDGVALSSRLIGLAPAMAMTSGVIGRAAGFGFDLRSNFSPGYGGLMPRIPVGRDGDAAARQHLRLLEIEESLRLIGLTLELLPSGPISTALPLASGEGIGCAESSRGDIWHWLRLDHGQIAAVFARDPGWAQWPAAERALRQTAAEDVDLVRASLALPASGMDL
jgi:Ni,Fe-hydrogenase III large subunit